MIGGCNMRQCLIICCVVSMIVMSACSINNQQGSINTGISEKLQSIVRYEDANSIISSIINYSELGRLELPYHLQGSYSIALTLEDVEESIGVECLRINSTAIYSIHKVKFENGNNGYCFISYKNGIVIDSWCVTNFPSKSQFKAIQCNITSVEEIKSIDPDTLVFEAQTPVSYHRFSDGSMMEIYYKKG